MKTWPQLLEDAWERVKDELNNHHRDFSRIASICDSPLFDAETKVKIIGVIVGARKPEE